MFLKEKECFKAVTVIKINTLTAVKIQAASVHTL